MKRTTMFMDAQLERELQALARRHGRPVAALVREAVAQYVAGFRSNRVERLGFIAVAGSGRSDTAERHEELLFAGDPQPVRPARPAPKRAPRSNRASRPRRTG